MRGLPDMAERRLDAGYFAFVAPALLFMLAFLAYPLWIVVQQSLVGDAGGFSLDAYEGLFASTLFSRVLLTTLEIALGATALTLLVAYPIAYHLSRQPPRRRMLLFALVLLPFWTSILVKSFAFLVIFGDSGFVASFLRALGFEPAPRMMFNRVGVMIGLVHFLIPLMVMPIVTSLLQRDANLEKAAQMMGAGQARIFFRIVLPLSMPGVVAGCLMTFVLSLGFFVTPALLGGRQDIMLANLVDVYMRQTFDWSAASAVSVMLLALTALMVVVFSRLPGGRAMLDGHA